jgi:hypothetical protein
MYSPWLLNKNLRTELKVYYTSFVPLIERLYENNVTTDRKLQFHKQEQELCSHNITSRSAWLMEPVNVSKGCQIFDVTRTAVTCSLWYVACTVTCNSVHRRLTPNTVPLDLQWRREWNTTSESELNTFQSARSAGRWVAYVIHYTLSAEGICCYRNPKFYDSWKWIHK